MAAPLVELKSIWRTFPGVLALRDVSMEVLPGEAHGLVGKNGAGKSTLINILTGLLPPDRGEIVVGGRHVHPWNRRAAIASGIALVPQQVKLVPGLSVAENMFAGQLPVGGLGFVRWKEVYRKAQDQLDALHVPVDARVRAESLRVAQQKMVAITTALFAEARVVVLDEPTAALPKHDAEIMFDFVRRMKGRGVAFIYISHHLDEVFEACDRVTVLRDGGYIGTYPVQELDHKGLVALISGAELEGFSRTTHRREGAPVLEVKGANLPGSFAEVSLSVQPGEVVGLAGLQGSGASEFLRALGGLEPMALGEVWVEGKPVSAGHPEQALEAGIALVTDDRRRYGIVGIRPVRENVSLSVLGRLLNGLGFLPPKNERELAEEYVGKLKVLTPSIEQPVEFLSGGNQQKVVFARVASTRPRILLLDQPAQGVDVQAKAEIFRIVDQLSAEGIGVIMLSSEIQELLGSCDRILVFNQGRIRTEVPVGSPQATEQGVLLLVEGG